MAKIKLTKGELKKQRDALKQYERYLPTLQLKKQQLQMEILHQHILLSEKQDLLNKKKVASENWAGFLSEPGINIKPYIKFKEVILAAKNVAGVDIALFEHAVFEDIEYDLFIMPLWVDHAAEELKAIISFKEEIKIIQKGTDILRQELRVTTQRVNLFEKVKIPETKEAIRLIKIYLGDQLANAVGRSKIAKAKIEENMLEEALV